MEYVKFKQGCFGLDFRFGHDYNLALAWMYTSIRHRGPALVYKCRASEQVLMFTQCSNYDITFRQANKVSPNSVFELNCRTNLKTEMFCCTRLWNLNGYGTAKERTI